MAEDLDVVMGETGPVEQVEFIVNLTTIVYGGPDSMATKVGQAILVPDHLLVAGGPKGPIDRARKEQVEREVIKAFWRLYKERIKIRRGEDT